jgi:hypothetical protein
LTKIFTLVAGRSLNAVNLNGTNHDITLPTGVVGALTNCTIGMWANLDSASTWSRLLNQAITVNRVTCDVRVNRAMTDRMSVLLEK